MNTNFINSVTGAVKELECTSLTNDQLAALAALSQQIEWLFQERQVTVDQEFAQFAAQVEQFETNEFISLANTSDREDYSISQLVD